MTNNVYDITIDCNQVTEILNLFTRYESIIKTLPERSSNYKKSIKLASLMEIMQILNAGFADNSASGNAIHELHEFDELRGILD